MSGETGVGDDIVLRNPVAVSSDLKPRSAFVMLQRLYNEYPQDIIESVDETGQDHLRHELWKPRISMLAISDEVAKHNFLARSDDWDWFLSTTEEFIPIAGSPEERKRIQRVLEVHRRPSLNLLDHRTFFDPPTDRAFVCFDAEGKAIAGASETSDQRDHQQLVTISSVANALRKARAPLLRERSEDKLRRLFAQSEHYLYPESELAHEIGYQSIAQYPVLEFALDMVELYEQFGNDAETSRNLTALCASPAQGLVMFCDSADDIRHLSSLVKKNQPWFWDLVGSYSTLCQDTITAGDPDKFLWEKPLEHHVYTLGHDLIRNALFHHDDPGFRQDFVDASMAALHDVLNYLHDIDLPAKIPKEKDMHDKLTAYTLQRAGDMVAMTAVIPLTEEWMRLKLGNLPPGEMEQATQYFYSVVRPSTLTASANRVTGDTERQIAVVEDIFIQLAAQGRWRQGDVFVDLGSSDRERIGKEHAKFLRKLAAPGKIIAVDAMAYTYPDEQDVVAVQMALEDPDLPMIHARIVGKQEMVPVDAAMMMWSVLNDIGPDKLQDVLNNVAKMLRKRDGDIPGGTLIVEVPMGYVEELKKMADDMGHAAFPAARLHYPIEEGKTVDKPLSIVYAYEMLVRAMRAGLEPLNLPPGKGPINVVCLYDTQAGKKRAFFVFERVTDPEPTLDQLVNDEKAVKVGSAQPGRPA